MNIPITFPEPAPSLSVRLDTVSRDLDTLRRQRQALELALAELGRGNLDTVKLLVKQMKGDTV